MVICPCVTDRAVSIDTTVTDRWARSSGVVAGAAQLCSRVPEASSGVTHTGELLGAYV